jgi:hypothetical protein
MQSCGKTLIGTTRVILEPPSFAILAATHDTNVKAEIDRLSSELLSSELMKLDKPWRFVVK